MVSSIVVMGVAGCGKSTVGALLARHVGKRFVDGDAYHSAGSIEKMQQGVPLTDADRQCWLAELGRQLAAEAIVLASSALRRSYRDQLREASPALRFVYLAIPFEESLRRVRARAGHHFFSPALVEDQFRVLEDPTGESGVLRVEGTRALAAIVDDVGRWLEAGTANGS